MSAQIPGRTQMRTAWRLHKLIWKLTGGRIGRRASGMDVLELVTTGHKSGEERSVLLFYLMDNDRPMVAGSNAGAAYDTAWVKNLRAHPHCRIKIDGKKEDVTAVFLFGEQRDLAYDRFKAAYPGYATYEELADRVIPVVRLESR